MIKEEIIEIEKYFTKYSENRYYHNEMDNFHIIVSDDNEVYQLDTDHEIFGCELKTLDEFKIRFNSFTGEDFEDFDSKEEYKRYEITTIEDFINTVTPDNFSNLMIDFTDVVIKMVQIKKGHKKLNGEYPISIMKSFTWIDDSIRGVKEMKFDDGTVLRFDPIVED